jgi:predicted Zn-dependent protease
MSLNRGIAVGVMAVAVSCGTESGDPASLGSVGQESHSWGRYHWARTTNPFVVAVGDNVSALWDDDLKTAIADWSQSAVLDLTGVTGNGSNCSPTAGRIEACNGNYGDNGWLGIARIWITRGSHIAQGVVQLNDFYWREYPYFYDDKWRLFVTCQEIGHTLGLDHVDEDFDNATQGTCMDYTNPLTAADLHPNAHDYEQLAEMYAHLDRFTSVGSVAAAPAAGADDWGALVASNGRVSLYVFDRGGGQQVVTRVIWAD